jgi:hypothetical protein
MLTETLTTSNEEALRQQLGELTAQLDEINKKKQRNREKARLWYENNREKMRARMRRYMSETIEGGKTRSQLYYEKNRFGSFENRLALMLTSAKNRCKSKGIEFNITKDEIARRETCPISGVILNFRASKISDDSPTLDRIDPSKGYVPGNVWVVSYRANRIKSNATSEELFKIAAAVKAVEDRLKMGLPACHAE